MYRVITCNTNGIRAAARKGFFTWLADQNADVVCIQEIKAKEVQLTDSVFYPGVTTVITTKLIGPVILAPPFSAGGSPIKLLRVWIGQLSIPRVDIFRWTFQV